MTARGQAGSGTGGSSFQKEDRTVNYEIGKVTSRTVAPVGTVRRISVAALVDGTYRETAGKDGGSERNTCPAVPTRWPSWRASSSGR